MTFPQLATGTTYAGAGTSHALDLPDDIAIGDWLVGYLSVNITGAGVTTTWPAGWAKKLNDVQGSGASHFGAIAWKRVASGDPELSAGSTTVTTADSVNATGYVQRWRGAHATSEPVVTSATGSGTGADCPSNAPPEGGTEDRSWSVALFANTVTNVSAFPAGYINTFFTTSGSTSGTRVTFAAGTRDLAAASEDPGSFTLNAVQNWVAATVAVRPAATGGTVTGSATASATASIAGAGTRAVLGAATLAGTGGVTAAGRRYTPGVVEWQAGDDARFTKKTFSSDGTQASALAVDTNRNLGVFTSPTGEDAAQSGLREAYLLNDAPDGAVQARGTFWGGPYFGSSEIGDILPQHGYALRYQEDATKRRAIIVWQNIFFGVNYSLLLGVWTGNLDGTGFVNRQVGLQLPLGATWTVTSSARSGGVVTLTGATTPPFVAGSYVSVNVATASFDGWHLVASVDATTVTFAQAGTDEAGGAGTAANVFPYDVDARITSGSIVEVRAKRRDVAAWPSWVPYDTDAGIICTGASGSSITTPDAAALDVTGDIELMADVTPSNNRATMSLISKYRTSDNQRSYRLRQESTTGFISFQWSPAGSGFVGAVISDAAVPASGRYAVRVRVDIANGSGGTTAVFETAPTYKGPWTQLGTTRTVTAGGDSSIFAGSAVLELGGVNTGGSERFTGRIHAASVRNGRTDSDPIVMRYVAHIIESGSTTWTDQAGLVWTLAGAPTFENTALLAGNSALAVDVDEAGTVASIAANPTPTGTGQAGIISAHLGTDARCQVVHGPFTATTSLAAEVTGAAAAAATGTVTAAGARVVAGAAAVGGGPAAIVVIGIRAVAGIATVGATAAVAGTGTRATSGAATVAGTAGITATGTRALTGTAAIASSAAVAAAGTRAVAGAAAVEGAGATTVAGAVGHNAAATVAAVVAVVVAGERAVAGVASLQAAGSASGVGHREVVGGAAAIAAGSVTVAGAATGEGEGVVTVTAAGSASAVGVRSTSGSAAVSAVGTVVAVGARLAAGAASVTATGSVAAAGTKVAYGFAPLSAMGSIAAAGVSAGQGEGAVIVPANSAIAASGVAQHFGAATVATNGTVAAAGSSQATGTAAIVAVATVLAVAIRSAHGAATVTATAQVAALGQPAAAAGLHATAGTLRRHHTPGDAHRLATVGTTRRNP